MTLRAVFCLLLLPASMHVRADEQVRRVQEELRKRNLYFGDVDGRATAEVRGAIRRYQERKGFAATGDLNSDTLRSLDIAPPRPAADEWPDITVMKSDAARQLAESDRKLLLELAAAAPDAGEAAPPESSAEPAPPFPEVVALGLTPAEELAGDLAERSETFVRDYLAACATNQLESELAFYAERLAYFDHGTVDRAFVARDVKRFYLRWPQREYELLDFKLTKARDQQREVTFKIAFRYKSPQHAVAGRSLNFFQLWEDEAGLRFTSLKEQRVKE